MINLKVPDGTFHRADGGSFPWTKVRRNAPAAILGVALVASAGLLLVLSWRLTFFQDSWEFLMNRRQFTTDALLVPHNEHIVVIPVGIMQLLLKVFGMSSATPEYFVLVGLLSITAILLFAYVRRRTNAWLALMFTVLILFLGPAWWDLLWPFEGLFVGSMLFGIAMLLAIERDDARGDAAACVFLVASVAFSSLGIAFIVGALVDVVQKRGSRGLRRGYFVAVPLLLYAAWYVGWGHNAESHLSLHNILASPSYVFEGIAAALDSLLGLSTSPIEGVGVPEWGRPLLIALVALTIYGQVRRPRFSRHLWPVVGTALAYWLLAAFNYIPGREATASRYIYVSAVFVVLVVANLMHYVKPNKRTRLAGGVVTIIAVASNLVPLKEGRDWLENQTVLTKADLAAIEISHRTVSPTFSLSPEVAGTPSLIDIRAKPYLEAVREYGSPAYTISELSKAPENGRRQADLVLARALPVSVTAEGPFRPTMPESENCRALPGAQTVTSDVPVSHGVTKVELPPGPSATISLRRFAQGEYPVTFRALPGNSVTKLAIPIDSARQPWYLHIEARQGVQVCGGGL